MTCPNHAPEAASALHTQRVIAARFAQRLVPAFLLALALGALPLTGMAPLRAAAAAWAGPADTRDAPSPDLASDPLPGDVRLGLEVAMSLADGVGIVEKEEWNKRLTRIGYQVAAVSEDSDTPYSFAVLDLEEPNAMALPGGFIFVTKGIMQADFSDDELAHLLGHEISHVSQRHFHRASRMNSILSLARTALMVGILMGADDSHSSAEIVTPDDPGSRDWAIGMTGKQALLQASDVFGGVLQALFERGYSRNLEFEADEEGSRLATRAGFSSEGGPQLLERLHERSFETHQYSYWRTHPYFTERLPKAQRLAARLIPGKPKPDDEYRQERALFFAKAAEGMRDPREALFLFERALRCEEGVVGSLAGALELVRFKGQREHREHPLLRNYGELIAGYDRILERANAQEEDWPQASEAAREREMLVAERDGLLDSQLEVILAEAPPTDFLERFIKNYPDHPRAGEMRYRLGMQYLLAGRPEKAVERLSSFAADSNGGAWADSAVAGMLLAIPELDDLSACYGVLEGHAQAKDPASVRMVEAARARMDELSKGDVSLEQGGAFLSNWPDSPWSAAVEAKVEAKAQEMLLKGRVHEGLRRYQEALDSYYTILTLAPDSPAASLASDGVDRIQSLAQDP
ncbi:MAG: M48 family metalloprotease [Candidatus Eisenbacteria bacterium]|nr:M48 family metalloprotease [Candidatus Eisenbacteria bacterium]